MMEPFIDWLNVTLMTRACQVATVLSLVPLTFRGRERERVSSSIVYPLYSHFVPPPPLGNGVNYCDQRCLFVSLYARSRISKTTRSDFITSSVFMLIMAVDRFSSDDHRMRDVIPVL